MRRYGLIGFPLGHSLSAEYFNARFAREGFADARYDLFPMERVEDLPALLLRIPELEGLNVTIPHKERVIPYLNRVDPVAAEIGSVNAIRITHPGGSMHLEGFNTDGPAFLKTLSDTPVLPGALVLGTGGAAKAVAWALAKRGTRILFVSRTPSGTQSISYEDLAKDPGLLRSHPVIVNTTPLGMTPHPETLPDIPYALLSPANLLYDLVYNPAVTLFLRKGAAAGAGTIQGETMFRLQAALSYSLFTG